MQIVSATRIMIDNDASGCPTLFIGGSWSKELESHLMRDDWETLAISIVDWPDYSLLKNFSERIRRIRVVNSPPSSKGLELLNKLESITLLDHPSPRVDFSIYEKLESLEIAWEKGYEKSLHNKTLKSLKINRVSGENLSWTAQCCTVTNLNLHGGKIKSLTGIENLPLLDTLITLDLDNCLNVSSIEKLHNLRYLDLQTPKAFFENMDWLMSMKNLKHLMLAPQVRHIDWGLVGSHPSLTSIGITAHTTYAATDEEIIRQIRACGKTVMSFKRFMGRTPSFIAELR